MQKIETGKQMNSFQLLLLKKAIVRGEEPTLAELREAYRFLREVASSKRNPGEPKCPSPNT